MPELPEVEVCCRGIGPLIIGHRILYTKVRNVNLRWPIAKEIIYLENNLVKNVIRRAKYLLIELEHGWIIVHLGMTGNLQILFKPQYFKEHDHIDLFISNGCIIRYSDPRRFGSWTWSNNLQTNKLLMHLGIEPLSEEFNGDWIFNNSRKKRTCVKNWLMNNKIVVGIGNIYSNESLFSAGILPDRLVNSLSQLETMTLSKKIKIILLDAIAEGGTTIRNFLQANSQKGNFTKKLKIYGKNGQPCCLCKKIIKMNIQNGRRTFFCLGCQH